MTVALHSKYSEAFPEEFNWELIDSPVLTKLANAICRDIKKDFRTMSRNETPGLRQALRQVAEIATVVVR